MYLFRLKRQNTWVGTRKLKKVRIGEGWNLEMLRNLTSLFPLDRKFIRKYSID
jgi:hypothetical protein